MPRTNALLAALLLLTAAVPPTAAADTTNEPPLADAGLDQSVTKGSTVLLDATASRDPDGTRLEYNWTIQTPGNGTTTPQCRTCPRTRFQPRTLGTYRVELTVTDDDGATRSDTLFVTVSPGDGPNISLSGPDSATAGSTLTYTASVERGAASLDYIRWTVDGIQIANHSLSNAETSDQLTKLFPTAGTQTVRATVYDTDGNDATDSISVDIDPATGGGDTGNAGGTDPSSGSNPHIATGATPTIRGDDLLTGAQPLRGAYHLSTDVSSHDIRRISWRNAAGPIATGTSLRRTWTPGDHELYAIVTYRDGSQNIATFPDGSTTVVADPKPNASIQSLNRLGSISGRSIALDAYDNLRDVRIEIDGTVVHESGLDGREHRRFGGDSRKRVFFQSDDITPGNSHTVTVVATDTRGQTDSATREITPVKKPEIIKSEFVNDPVDSYHPRIDADRYTARHVLKIDLNGVEPENLSVDIWSKDSDNIIDQISRDVSTQNGIITVSSTWTANYPGKYILFSSHDSDMYGESITESLLNVNNSPPELDFSVTTDGTSGLRVGDYGIIIDAGKSFDPDGTNLEYIWKRGARPIKSDNTTAKFSSLHRAFLTIRDGHGLTTSRQFDYLNRFIPKVETMEVLSEGPYKPSDTVRVRVTTESFRFSKNRYYEQYDLRARLSTSAGEIADIERRHVKNRREVEKRHPVEYSAVVEVPAQKLSGDRQAPSVTFYNAENHETTQSVRLPTVDVLEERGVVWRNISVKDLEYRVKRPLVSRVSTTSESDRNHYLAEGYTVRDEDHYGTKYHLEKYTQVQEEKYETLTKSFRRHQERKMFLRYAPEWHASGTQTATKRWTETRTEWFDSYSRASSARFDDSNLRNGEYTGNSRRVVVDPAEYRVKKQFRYEYEVEKQGTRQITKTKTIPVAKTGTRRVRRCNRYIGCYWVQKEYTYWTTKTVEFTKTKTYTYTVTRHNTYWARGKHHWSHHFTGRTKRKLVDDADYSRQYEIKYEEPRSKQVTEYVATRRKKVQEARYEWIQKRTTTESTAAKQTVRLNDNWRIGSTSPATQWTLTKQDGYIQKIVSSYQESDSVLETRAEVSGVAERVYVVRGEDTTVLETIGRRSEDFVSQDAKTRVEIVDEFGRVRSDSGSSFEWCEIKKTC